MDSGHWDISKVGEFDPADYFGFVYLVTNLKTGKKYIGKKSMWSTTSKQVWKVDRTKGKKTKKITKESYWRTYTTSSVYVNAELVAGETFSFQILSLHNSKGALAYSEVWHLVTMGALTERFADGSRAFYNAKTVSSCFTVLH